MSKYLLAGVSALSLMAAAGSANAASFEKKLGQFGGPEMTVSCAKKAKFDVPLKGRVEVCIGHTYKFKQHEYFLVVDWPDVKGEVEAALRKAAEVSLVAALGAFAATPGEVIIKSNAALAAFKVTFFAAMSADALLGELRNKVSVKIDHRSHW